MMMGVFAVMASFVFYVMSGMLTRHMTTLQHKFYGALGGLGFRYTYVNVQGVPLERQADVEAILHPYQGAPLFRHSLADLYQALKSISWVKTVRLERRLPHTLSVILSVRTPVAIWQSQKTFFLIDEEGVVIRPLLPREKATLMVITGEGAPKALCQLRQDLSHLPALQGLVKGASYVGKRRWDVYLKQGMKLKLPEQGLMACADVIGKLQQKDMFTRAHIRAIDLRVPGKIYFLLQEKAFLQKSLKAQQKTT
jgi:cell division protein FtsQ